MKKRIKKIPICCVILAIVLLVISYNFQLGPLGSIAGAIIGVSICYMIKHGND